MNLFTKRFGLVLAGVVGVGAVAALAVGASFALFTAQTSTTGQTFTAGSVSFNGTHTGTCTTDVGNMEPGDTGSCSVSVKYNGSLPAYIGAEASGSGYLTNALSFQINGTSQNGTTPVLIGNSATDGHGSYSTTVDYTFSSSADNTYQTTTSTVTVTFFAVQCSNNGLNTDGTLSNSLNDSCSLQPASWTETPVSGGSTNGVSIDYDNGLQCNRSGSPCFSPRTGLTSGEATALDLTVFQNTNENPDATVTLTWNGNMAFTGVDDSSALCTSTSNSATCTYTDFAHGDKSDTWNFTVGSNPSGTEIVADIEVTTGPTDGGTATAQAEITTA